jgi:small GTP-binding protein
MAADAEKRKRMLAAQNHLPSNQSEPARRIKLLLLGDSGVGKSSLINRWTLDTFTPSLTSTIGVNFKSKKISYQGELMQVQVWDTAGQENFHKITTSYYKGAQGIMLVYDVSDQKSMDNVEYWIKNIKSHASDSVQVVLVGNKIDLRQSQLESSSNNSSSNNNPTKDSGAYQSPSSSTSSSVHNSASFVKCIETERGKEIAKKFSVPFFEVSAKDSSHVDDAYMTLVHHIIDASVPKHHLSVRASLQGMDKKTVDSRAASSPNVMPNSPPSHQSPTNNSNTPPSGGSGSGNNNNSGSNSGSGTNNSSNGNILKSLGFNKKSSSASNSPNPDKGGNAATSGVANNNTGGGGGQGGDDKEKCIIS